MIRPPTDEQQWCAALSALLDGEEPDVSLTQLNDHLGACPTCGAWLDRVTAVNAGLRSLPVLQPALGESVVNLVDVRLCGCAVGAACVCNDCQCGGACTCHQQAG